MPHRLQFRRSLLVLTFTLFISLLALSLSCQSMLAVVGQSSSSFSSTLEPGEIPSTHIDSNVHVEQGPVIHATIQCDAAQSRKARQIIKDLFLSRLPPEFILPITCPFHPYLDMMLQDEKLKQQLPATGEDVNATSTSRPATVSKQRIGSSQQASSSHYWKCLTCGRVFVDQTSIDHHIQRHHMLHVESNAVCLADLCDVLDCRHRTIQFDPLTGEVLLDGLTEGGIYGSSSSRAKRLAAARKASQLKKSGIDHTETRTIASASVASPASAPTVPVHPHSDRCDPHAQELARARCNSILLTCLPFVGTHAYGLPSQRVHELYNQFQKELCEPLKCTEDGQHANVVQIAHARQIESSTRLYTLFFVLILFALFIFYFLVFSLRSEFGWRSHQPGASSSLLAADRHSTRGSIFTRLQRWWNGQQKRRTSPSKLF